MSKRIWLLFLVIVIVSIFFIFDFEKYLSLEYVKSQQSVLNAQYEQQPALFIAIFSLIYIAVTALAIPGATVMTLAAGALFGVFAGLVIVSFASTIGATFSFLISRYLLRDIVQNKYSHKLTTINEGIKKEGDFYLFSMRLVPIFPFFLINLLMGLTPIKTVKFFFVSQIGMIAGTAVYVFAGTKLAEIESMSGILSPDLIMAFVVLGVFPLIAKKWLDRMRAYKMLKKFKKPAKYDYNLIVIGAGSAGLVLSYIASAVKAKVVLIEKHKMGGDCLNTGCVPSKTFIKSAKVLAQSKNAKKYGLGEVSISFEFKDVMDRVHDVIRQIEPHDSAQRYTELGVDCIEGEAKIIDPYRVHVNGKTLTAPNIIVATGASPFVPLIKGLNAIKYLTSNTIWDLR